MVEPRPRFEPRDPVLIRIAKALIYACAAPAAVVVIVLLLLWAGQQASSGAVECCCPTQDGGWCCRIQGSCWGGPWQCNCK